MELKERVDRMKDKEFAGYCVPGCGALLGLRLVVQNVDKFMLVSSPGCVSMSGPYVNAGSNAAAAASAAARATKELVIAYASDEATELHLSSLIDACLRQDNFIYICYNNFHQSGLELKSHIKSVVPYARYSATASVAY